MIKLYLNKLLGSFGLFNEVIFLLNLAWIGSFNAPVPKGEVFG